VDGPVNGAPDVYLTVDVEPDCPPFLWTWRGIDEGMPALLELLAARRVPATFFTTGNVARRSPWVCDRIVRAGHELASHGMTHRAFDRLDEPTARWEIRESLSILREHDWVRSFRAPYLRFPDSYLGLLEDARIDIDASLAKYKRAYRTRRPTTRLRRVAASLTSSALRLPAAVRDRWLAKLESPIVLFVHPWEFVDLRKSSIRWDCRMGTGEHALRSLEATIASLASRGARFHRIDALLSAEPAA
jgi:peptidoglycan/xylan/chitin deacetylase (PgdA/CDA1 family)